MSSSPKYDEDFCSEDTLLYCMPQPTYEVVGFGHVLGPYNTSDYPVTIVVIPLINIVVPLLPPYCYYCAP